MLECLLDRRGGGRNWNLLMGSQEENSSVSVAENRVAVVGNSCLHHLFDGVEAGQAEDRCSPQAAVRWQQAEAGVGRRGREGGAVGGTVYRAFLQDLAGCEALPRSSGGAGGGAGTVSGAVLSVVLRQRCEEVGGDVPELVQGGGVGPAGLGAAPPAHRLFTHLQQKHFVLKS